MEKITLDHPDSQSADLVAQHIEQLSQLFPEVIKEGKVDFEALQDLLGNYIDTPEERFQLNWAGKAQARREAQKRSTGTLRPCPEESVNWNTTENLYIEGENLEVLKLLQKSYYKKVKMIYIDPPYNTGKDFVYKDNYNDNLANYLEFSGQDCTLGTNTESDGRYHSNWLNMMYSRLKLARNLLTDDGVIFISIDDNEVANLKKVCDEIFGEENFLAQIIHKNNSNKNQSKLVSVSTEYMFGYSKNKETLKDIIWRVKKKGAGDVSKKFIELKKLGLSLDEINEEIKEMYKRPKYSHLSRWNKVDENGVFKDADLSRENGPKNYTITNPLTGKDCVIPNRGWGKSLDELKRLQELNLIWYGDDNTPPAMKDYIGVDDVSVPDNFWFFDNSIDTKWVKDTFSALVFENPKPLEMIKQLIQIVSDKSDIVLDFFSGSATTAHAVMQLNAEDGGYRKYIMVQLPETTPVDSEARKAGYKTIAEIGKERIRRAGKKIVEELKAKKSKEGALFAEEKKKLDIGFKVFKLDSSNINTWDSSPSNLEGALYNSVQNIKSDRTEHDLLYEILLKYGIDLIQPINEHILAGKKVYEMGAGALIVCMADHVKPEAAEAIAKLWKEVKPTAIDESSKAAINCRVVFKDKGFDDNNDKTNVLQILKQHGIDNVVTI